MGFSHYHEHVNDESLLHRLNNLQRLNKYRFSILHLDKILYDNNELFRLDPKCSKQSLRKIHIFWKKGYGIISFVIAV